MRKNLKATSIIEAIIVLMVVVTGITWVYKLMISSQKLTNSTAQRIEAIQIARDGLESFTNIRDTNWLVFAWDPKNCWNVLNYDNRCIWSNNKNYDIKYWVASNRAFIIYRNYYNQFELQSKKHNWNDYTNSTYRNRFKVQKDSRGFYTQSWGIDTSPLFTREIRIDYLDANNNSLWSNASNQPKLKVTAIVQWSDLASKSPRKLEMSTLLTNWKNTN